ncbi:MAG: hypothetical protein AB7I27_12385 [Bacteriovoracaceae bacterium]
MQSQYLCIQVKQDGSEKVSLKLPIATLGWIETLMPEAVLEQITKRGIDLKAIAEKAKSENYRPQTLFEMDTEVKVYKVWIE